MDTKRKPCIDEYLKLEFPHLYKKIMNYESTPYNPREQLYKITRCPYLKSFQSTDENEINWFMDMKKKCPDIEKLWLL